jgi:dolichyl-phosphate-mannose-protein mannosyltransferase
LATAGGLVLLWTLLLAVKGSGLSLTLFHLQLSSRDPFRSLVAGAVLGSLGLAGLFFKWPGERRLAACAACVAALTCLLGLSYGTYVAAGADTYGYVSQADLWLKGSLITPIPLASEGRWRDADWALTPLGYRPALREGFMVPVYPIGLPLTMAAVKSAIGNWGAFVVSPVCGALLVWLTYVFGRTLHRPETGLLAAIALAASPVFLFYLMVPMSDLPVTAWWVTAAVLALSPQSRWRLLMAGGATALAVLTRPNLVVLIAPMAVLVTRGAADNGSRFARLAWYGIPGAAGALGVAVANTALYGSPLQSGYGSVAALYSPRYTWSNLAQFTAWMLRTQTPFIFLALFARRWYARWCLAFALCVLACYLWYLPFDNWTYLRFLLPAIPMLLVAASETFVTAVRRYALPNGVVLAAALILVCAGLWQGRAAFTIGRVEARYRAASDVVRTLPANAVVISNLHSGSIRAYANRMTLRYEWLGADQYAEALRTLREHGHPLYALLDGAEVADFRERYRRVADLSWMDGLPLDVINGSVYLYAIP